VDDRVAFAPTSFHLSSRQGPFVAAVAKSETLQANLFVVFIAVQMPEVVVDSPAEVSSCEMIRAWLVL
jgi:hypothetical protein